MVVQEQIFFISTQKDVRGRFFLYSVDFEISDLRMQPYSRLFGVGIVLVFSTRKFRIEFFMIKVEVL